MPKSRLALCGAVLAAVLGAWLAPASAGPSILVDANTAKVIAQNDAFHRWYPASLTKLMTAYVAFRAVQQGEVTLASPVRITARAAAEPPSKMGYPPGTVITLDNAIKMIMVKSANDVATAIGESLAGSQEAFAARMNAEAKRIGMTGSNFVNAHGLHDERQYTTARDLAVLGLTLRAEFPQYALYYKLEAIGSGKDVIENHNTLIGRFEGADGMKTGYTCPAGYNLVATATRNGRTMLAVVIGAMSVATRADEAADLLAKGFATSPAAEAPTLATLPVSGTANDQAVNMRETVCSQQAAKARRDALDENGRLVFKSAHMTGGLLPPPRVTEIAIGGATGPASPFLPKFERPSEVNGLPVPLPRPERPGEATASADATANGSAQ